jgi:DNA invertase Pin-like site-specific DNA recombinase
MKAIAYYRVSTEGQRRSGLGLEAQQASVRDFCQTRGATLLAEFTEVESGKANDRPALAKALDQSRLTGATLVIAKLDRLSRNAAFLLTLRESGIDFVAADMAEANAVTVGVMAVIAEQEREAISARTKAALAAAKARGVRLGNPNGAAALRRSGIGNTAGVTAVKAKATERARALAGTILEIQRQGAGSLCAIASELNMRHILTSRGGRWHASTVRNLMQRLSTPDQRAEPGSLPGRNLNVDSSRSGNSTESLQ